MYLQSQLAFSQCGADINLNTWIEEGDTANGLWAVSVGGDSVLQSINGDPTFFVSPDSFINVRIHGDIQVNTASDDDWIGFVFGYEDPDTLAPNNFDFYVFAWKQADQNFSGYFGSEGFTLAKVSGPVTNLPQAFSSFAGPYVTVLGTQYGNTQGWNDFQIYSFELTYTNTNCVISIDGDTIFDIVGCFPPGRFGFYNYSLADVIYSNFNYQVAAAFQVLTPEICLGDTAFFQALSDSCENAAGVPLNNTIISWYWDFGDGANSNDTNAVHLYNYQGIYNVVLVVTDYLNCTDTATHRIQVNPLLSIDPSNDTLICPGDSIFFDAGSGYVSYLWQNGSTNQTLIATTAGAYSVTCINSYGCQASDTVLVGYHPLPNITISPLDPEICINDSIYISAIGADSITWSNYSSLSSSVGSSVMAFPISNTIYTVTGTDTNGCVNTSSFELIVHPLPLVSLNTSQDSICQGDTTIIEAAGAAIYSWGVSSFSTLNNNSINAYPTLSSVFHVVGTDTNGCLNSDSIWIFVFPPTIISLTPAQASICYGQTQVFNVNGAQSYNWSPSTFLSSANLSTVVSSSPDSIVYTVTGIDSNQCTTESNVVLNVIPLPNVTATITDSIICRGQYDTLIANGANSYVWSPIISIWGIYNSTAMAAPSNTQTYTVTGTGLGGCTATDTVVVEVYPVPDFDAGPDTFVCRYDSVQLQAFGGVNYIWGNDGYLSADTGSSPFCFPPSSRFYNVTITDTNGCQYGDGLFITVESLPFAKAGPDEVICEGQSVYIGGNPTGPNGADYFWTPIDGITSNTIPDPMATPDTTTTYKVRVTSEKGCKSYDYITIQVNPRPLIELLSAPNIQCSGDTVQVIVTGGLESYKWSPIEGVLDTSSSSARFNPLISRVYTVLATDENGCTNTASIDMKVLNRPVVKVSPEQSMCLLDTIDLFASGGVTYFWSGEDWLSDKRSAAPLAFPTKSTIYRVTVSDTNGCTNVGTIPVTVFNLPYVDAGEDIMNCRMETVYLGGFPSGPDDAEFNWEPSSKVSNSFIPNPTVIDTGRTMFYLTVTSPTGCVSADSVFVNSDCYETVYVPNAFSPDEDGINEVFKVYYHRITEPHFIIYDRWGHIIYESNNLEEGWNGKYMNNGELVQVGTYFWKLYYKTESGRFKDTEGSVSILR